MSDSSWSFIIRVSTRITLILLSITFLQTKSYTVNGAAVIASEVASSNNNDQSGTFTDGQQQQNQTATVDGYHQFQQSSSSRHSYGTVDDYRNRIQNMFRLLENRPDQGCQSTRVYRFYCPTPHPQNPETGWVCIKIDDLCNNIPDCPGAEDEDPTQCMYYLAIQHQAYQLRTIIINQLQHQTRRQNEDNNDF